jgi:methyl-accepting chemotaxis protein
MFQKLLRFGDNADKLAKITALDKVQAVIEFDLNGIILDANKNFCGAMGYDLSEIKGQHHRMFVTNEYANSAEYRDFWARLGRGEFETAEYKRIAKGGREIWINASYNPIFGKDGKPYKVVKFAIDVTKEKLRNAEFEGQLNAVNKSQATIEFTMNGEILNANRNFCDAVGYDLSEIKGKHHSMFVDPAYRNSAEYRQFWDALGRGEYQAGKYRRFGKGGREIWIQASYNPILDLNGKLYKVIKFATDITHQVNNLNNVKALVNEKIGAIDKAVNDVSAQTTSVASASIQTSTNVQTVASAAEELNASVREISSSMARSRESVDRAFMQAQEAEKATQRLTASARSMTTIVELIQNIANQINLLSLNATIESARAGEAGKGFAVVAGEVKNLAKQAADATEQISNEISGIQSVSGEVAQSLEGIKTSVESVRAQVANVAAAVEEQSAVTQEMSSNMQTACQAVASITKNVTEIEAATQSATIAVKETQEAARAPTE